MFRVYDHVLSLMAEACGRLMTEGSSKWDTNGNLKREVICSQTNKCKKISGENKISILVEISQNRQNTETLYSTHWIRKSLIRVMKMMKVWISRNCMNVGTPWKERIGISRWQNEAEEYLFEMSWVFMGYLGIWSQKYPYLSEKNDF